MVNDPRIAALSEPFWRKYLDTPDQVEWVLRRAEWERLLAGVFEAGYNEGFDEGDE